MNFPSMQSSAVAPSAPRLFTAQLLTAAHPRFFQVAGQGETAERSRQDLTELIYQVEWEAGRKAENQDSGSMTRIRDCAQVLRTILRKRSEKLSGFSIMDAFGDLAAGRSRPDLTPAFHAEIFYLLDGLLGREVLPPFKRLDFDTFSRLSGRTAATERSRQLDRLWRQMGHRLASYPSGIGEEAVARRQQRAEKIRRMLDGRVADWQDWRWQVRHVIRDPDLLNRLVTLSEEHQDAVAKAHAHGVPFGITPYYLSLMDEAPSELDASIRAQVLPSMDYVDQVCTGDRNGLDFMGEEDTAPVDLVTRRYPGICILKPFNTCPQICVYCQRNWEIEDVMAAGAFAGMARIDSAIDWIAGHPAIREVLVTGGDPLAMGDQVLQHILEKIARIEHVERIRVGTRTFVTMPMRFTSELAAMFASLREPGRRELALITHVQHPYEITPELMASVEHCRRHAIPVYNQMVYTFFNSRRFEAAALRKKLRLIGIDPYYTFNTKGKEETVAYRVPLARLLQEQQEEARLLPGLVRTDEAVFNLPRIGKSYLKAKDQRDLVAILPDGARVYEFHPWERCLSQSSPTYLFTDVPILSYLERLAEAGEDPAEYETIWYYF
jgi:lysine 2,3-aminomutase